ncbi:MAG: TetR/AcrR family transcriptional regulator [Cyanobacteria bacterium]|nr:TetR/AcrR family transcriptional regulator [Cyanobacteriota bacterium]
MPRHSSKRATPDSHGTSDQILDVAERLAQTRGFNGFSYADVAAELGITTAGLHYHFPTKADLGRALIDRYSKTFGDALQAIEASGAAAPAQLQRYVDIYAGVLKAGRICLCGMFAAEYTTLPDGMQKAIRSFFDLNEKWLSRLLAAGRKDGSLAFEGSPQEGAGAITSALEGSMLLARTYGGAERFKTAADRVLRDFAPKKPKK